MTESQKPPVFIVGSPRSGTSLLRSLLSRHPSIAICGETRFFADIYKFHSAFGPLDNANNRERLVDRWTATARMRYLKIDPAPVRQRLLNDATSYPAFLDIVLRSYAGDRGKERCGEKTPHHAFFTEVLSDWYPGAYIIHIVRDPRDVVASLQRMPWAPKSILNNASMWVLFNRAAEKSRHRPAYLQVRYEHLVASPQQTLSKICDHIGEHWPTEIEIATSSPDPYSWPRSIAGPVTSERLDKWKDELRPQEVALVERIAGARMDEYGYARNGGSVSFAKLIPATAAAALDLARERLRDIPYTWAQLTRPTNLALHEYWKYRRVWDAVFPGLTPLHQRK